jgi:hypothetical protein
MAPTGMAGGATRDSTRGAQAPEPPTGAPGRRRSGAAGRLAGVARLRYNIV